MRSEAWRPAAAARNRLPREAREVARQALRPGCEELAERIRVMPETEARPRVKNRHGGAPRGERPASWDARRLASAWRAALCARPTGAAAPERLSALRPPSLGVSEARLQTSGAENAPREGERLFVWRVLLYALVVLILRSARAEKVPQIRTRVRASRRMRTSDWVRPHASRRIAAHLGCGSACARVARKSGLLDLRL